MSAITDTTSAWKTIGKVLSPGMTMKEVQAGYDEWSTNYDELLQGQQYLGPVVAAEEVIRNVAPERRAEVRVMDVAAGTGLVGRDLAKAGFRHVDAIEPSEGMMKKLRETKAYTNEYLEFIGTGQCTVPNDTYDVVVMAGGMGDGHVPVCGLDELVRVAKKGGLVIITTRVEFLSCVADYKDKLEPYMERMEKNGTWTKVEKRIFPNYLFEKEGVLFIYRVN